MEVSFHRHLPCPPRCHIQYVACFQSMLKCLMCSSGLDRTLSDTVQKKTDGKLGVTEGTHPVNRTNCSLLGNTSRCFHRREKAILVCTQCQAASPPQLNFVKVYTTLRGYRTVQHREFGKYSLVRRFELPVHLFRSGSKSWTPVQAIHGT